VDEEKYIPACYDDVESWRGDYRMIELDEFQEPTRNYNGNAILMAGPGAGKTRTIAARIEYLRRTGVPLKDIKMLTFSRQAAGELLHRQPDLGKCVQTIHAFGNSLLKRSYKVVGMAYTESQFSQRKGFICGFLDVPLYKIMNWGGDHELVSHVKEILDNIDRYKSRPDSDLPSVYKPAYNYYEESLRRHNLIDFNDMLSMAIEEIKKNPVSIKWLFLDEGHDTSMLQYELVRNIQVEHAWGIFSPHQMIYRWNGADERNMERFTQDYSPRQFNLLNNWRSNKKIVDLLECIYQDGLIPKNTEEGEVKFHQRKAGSQFELALDLVKDAPSYEILARTNLQLNSNGVKDIKKGTIHWSKGTEADTVVLLGAGYPFIPHTKSMDYEEECNLLYVACSRAKRSLHILYETTPSEFFGSYKCQQEVL